MQVAAAAAYSLLSHPDSDYPPSSDHPSSTDPCFGSDFGGLVRTRPKAVLSPLSPADVTAFLNLAALSSLPLAPRGNGHSVHGQAQAHDALVLNMRSLSLPFTLLTTATGAAAADVSAGALWSELLTWSLESFGLAPASWTDYLDLTVGGTLSNGGISGQAFRHGPQVSNVTELEVVTADGQCHVCSPDRGSDLFLAVLGGLGQFGVITRARIPLLPAPDMVKWIRVVYGRFGDYKQDAESLVTRPEPDAFDYVEGFAFVNSDDPVNGYGSVPLAGSEFDAGRVPPGSGPVLYCLEVALHYQQGDNVDKRVTEMLRPLRYVRGLEFSTEVSYVDFLTRVKRAEKEARANGSWNAPHPWLNLLVSSSDIVDFDRNVFKGILKEGIGGPMLVYPLVRSKGAVCFFWGGEKNRAGGCWVWFGSVAVARYERTRMPFGERTRASHVLAIFPRQQALFCPHCGGPHSLIGLVPTLVVGPADLGGPTRQRDLLPGGAAAVQQTVPGRTAGRGPDQPEPSDHRVLPNQRLRFQDVPPPLQDRTRVGAALWEGLAQICRSQVAVRSDGHPRARSADFRQKREAITEKNIDRDLDRQLSVELNMRVHLISYYWF